MLGLFNLGIGIVLILCACIFFRIARLNAQAGHQEGNWSGMLASVTAVPVVGVPVPLAYLDGMDSLLSIVQMPAGIPVATVSIGGARNAGILAARILGTSDADLADRVEAYARDLEQQVEQKNQRLKDSL